MYECPVCRYAYLEVKPYQVWPPPDGVDLRPPYVDQLGAASYEVCSSCGFEFGFDDNPGWGAPTSFDEYRVKWESEGRPWFNKRIAEPLRRWPERPS
jgi:rubredoxin